MFPKKSQRRRNQLLNNKLIKSQQHTKWFLDFSPTCALQNKTFIFPRILLSFNQAISLYRIISPYFPYILCHTCHHHSCWSSQTIIPWHNVQTSRTQRAANLRLCLCLPETCSTPTTTMASAEHLQIICLYHSRYPMRKNSVLLPHLCVHGLQTTALCTPNT